MSSELLRVDHAGHVANATIAAVVCTYDEARWPQLWTAVDSLRRQRPAPTEIIVVVDHNPRLLERVRVKAARRAGADDAPAVTVTANRQQRGLSGGRNTALRLTGCDLVAFLDDDAEADADWLSLLATGFVEPRVAAVGSTVVPRWASGARPRWLPPELDWTVGCTHVGTPRVTSEVRNSFGGAMMLRRRDVIAAGGYHTALGRVGNDLAGCEETELCIRLRRRRPDTIVMYEPSAAIRHDVPLQRERWRYVLQRCHAEGRSKALVSLLAGHRHGLASERRYVAHTLPRGIARGVADTLRGDLWGVARLTTLVCGVAAAATGFAIGRLRSSLR